MPVNFFSVPLCHTHTHLPCCFLPRLTRVSSVPLSETSISSSPEPWLDTRYTCIIQWCHRVLVSVSHLWFWPEIKMWKKMKLHGRMRTYTYLLDRNYGWIIDVCRTFQQIVCQDWESSFCSRLTGARAYVTICNLTSICTNKWVPHLPRLRFGKHCFMCQFRYDLNAKQCPNLKKNPISWYINSKCPLSNQKLLDLYMYMERMKLLNKHYNQHYNYHHQNACHHLSTKP